MTPLLQEIVALLAITNPLGVYLLGMTLIIVYLVNIYRIWRGKVGQLYH